MCICTYMCIYVYTHTYMGHTHTYVVCVRKSEREAAFFNLAANEILLGIFKNSLGTQAPGPGDLI